MSAIDQYKHKHLGFIECPSSFNIVNFNSTKKVAIYELMENIPNDEDDFDGKTGDIILGGGSGEVAAFRISIPQSLLFFTLEDWDDFENIENLFKAFWTPTESYKLCEGYSKLGWTPESPVEFWLAENLCCILLERFAQYAIYKTINWCATSDLILFEKDFFDKD